MGNGDLAVADEVIAADVTNHNLVPGQPPGRDGMRQDVENFRGAFPDLEIATEQIVAEGDAAVVRWTARGTHRGELMGIPPTGARVTITGIDILRIANGQIVERWGEFDGLGLMQQLGAIPAPEVG